MVTWESIGISTKGKTGRFYTVCPKCSSDRKKAKVPCLTVNDEPNDRWWNCHHCGWCGNLESFERYEKIWQKSKMPSVIRDIFSPAVMEMLLIPKRISAKTATLCKVYEVAPWAAEKYNQVAFPYYYRGNLANVKFRRLEYDISITLPSGEERYLSKNWQLKKDDGAKVCWWGLEMLNFEENQDIIIAEGETDRMTWIENGFPNVLSVPNGGINPEIENLPEKLEFAKDEWIVKNIYPKVNRFILALDDDAAGNRMKDELAAIFGKRRCWVVTYGGRKDINEVHAGNLKKELSPLGKQGVEDCFNNAKPYPVGGIFTFDMIAPKLEEIAINGFKRGYIIGAEHDHGINQLISLKQPFLGVITGIPKMGKSSWWRWYITQQSLKNGLKWGLFVPDSRPEEREIAKICEVMVGAKWEKNKPWSMNDTQRARAKDFVREFFYLIKPDSRNQELLKHLGREEISVRSLQSLKYYFESLKVQHNIFGYVIDAWNKIEHHKPNGMTDEHFISKQLDFMLEINYELELFGSIVAHPTKMEKEKDGSGNYTVPDLYNVKGSSAWFEKADWGLSIHRKKYRRIKIGMDGRKVIYKYIRDPTFPTQVIITAIKHDEIGKEGEIDMFMDWKKAETFTYTMPDYYETSSQDDIVPDTEVPDDIIEDDDLPF